MGEELRTVSINIRIDLNEDDVDYLISVFREQLVPFRDSELRRLISKSLTAEIIASIIKDGVRHETTKQLVSDYARDIYLNVNHLRKTRHRYGIR